MRDSGDKKSNILGGNTGFSIVELLLAIALLLIALGLGYNLLFFARSSFERAEERWMEQNQVVAVSNIIYDAINEAYYLEIVADENNIPSGLDYYGAFYVNTAGKTIYEHFDNSSVTKTEMPGENLVIMFSIEEYTINEFDFIYGDLMTISVVSDVLDYTLETKTHLNNMNRDRIIQGLASGSTVVFKTKEVVETVPEDLYNSLCFVATAAYESPMNPSVMLLRRFRDDALLETVAGTKFVEFYYKNSPPVATVIAENAGLRFITRAVLYPVVGLVSLLMNPLHLICVLSGIFLTLVVFKKKYGLRTEI